MRFARRSWFKAALRHPPRRLLARRRLTVERLEDRTVLSVSPLDAATPLAFNAFNTAHAAHFLSSPSEIDLYRVTLHAGDTIDAGITAQASGSGLASVLRIFDSRGTPLARNNQEGGDPQLKFQTATA